MENYVKILFKISANDPNESEVESLWAFVEGTGYKIVNIPFYVKSFALNDIVSAVQVDDCLYATGLLQPSGHSTIRIWFSADSDVQVARNELKQMGCNSEVSDQPRLIAVDVPKGISYSDIKKYLDQGESDGRWDYEEACLG